MRPAVTERLGDIVFGLDDETMEQAVAGLLVDRGLALGLAESLTGGLIASRLVDVPGGQPVVPGRRGGLRHRRSSTRCSASPEGRW